MTALQELLALLSANRIDEALPHMETLVHAEPERTEWRHLRELAGRLSRIQRELAPRTDTPLPAARTFRHNVRRNPVRLAISDGPSAEAALQQARAAFNRGDAAQGADIFEQLIELLPAHGTALLAELHDHYQRLPDAQNRYSLYVSRYFDFQIRPGDNVLDIGSGHDPFPLSTHLADFAPEDDHYGRAGQPLKQVAGKPFYACSVEEMPFADKEFDFIYCSHVMEHVQSPERACRELMRVGKRGYIESPTPAKDMWLNTARSSNHLWGVTVEDGVLAFNEYGEREIRGLGSGIVLDMHCAPQTPREKALSALLVLKSEEINTMLYWEDEVTYRVRRR